MQEAEYQCHRIDRPGQGFLAGTGINILYLYIYGSIDSILMLKASDSYVEYLNIIYFSQFECLPSFIIQTVIHIR